MSFMNRNRHSFIIQLWCEPREIESAPEQWRGIIEHTISGERCAVFTTDDIINFIGIHVNLQQQSQQPQNFVQTRLSRRDHDEPPTDELANRE